MEPQTNAFQEYTQETISSSPFTSFLHNRDIEKHRHLFFEFTFCLSGEIVNVVNGVEVPTKAFRELLILRPGDTHEMIKRTSPSLTPEFHRDIYCQKDKFKAVCAFLKPGLFEEILDKKEPIVVQCERTALEAIEAMASSLACDLLALKDNMESLERHHTVVLCNILDLYLGAKREKKEHYPEWIRAFLQSLNTERTLRMPIGEIVKELHYSRGHMCREFKKYVGKTMVECLNESRIFYGAMLLRNSDVAILDVAMRLNFSSQSAFTNAFKKVYGVSPKAWRNAQR